MSAAASASDVPSKKAAQTTHSDESSVSPGKSRAAQSHMVQHLSALAMLLDEDHVEELLLSICRDNDMVMMLYRRDSLPHVEADDYDGAELFAVLNTSLWEEGRKRLAAHLSFKDTAGTGPHPLAEALDTAASAMPVGGCGARTLPHGDGF